MQPITSLAETQKLFVENIREQRLQNNIKNVKPDRMQVYMRLVYNNIEGNLRQVFPVLFSLLPDKYWDDLVHQFVKESRGPSPYFFDISKQFVSFLNTLNDRALLYPFMRELAHYEWIELDVELQQEVVGLTEQKKGKQLSVTNTTRILGYEYPAHKISKAFIPSEPGNETTFLIVYRDKNESVQFMETNALTVQLLNIVLDGDYDIEDALKETARQGGFECSKNYLNDGRVLCEGLIEKNILVLNMQRL